MTAPLCVVPQMAECVNRDLRCVVRVAVLTCQAVDTCVCVTLDISLTLSRATAKV